MRTKLKYRKSEIFMLQIFILYIFVVKNFRRSRWATKIFLTSKFPTCARGSIILVAQDLDQYGRV